MSGGTDAKAWSKLGIRCFGFSPLRLPADLDFTALFHGVDERVPIDALEFSARVLDGFLDRAYAYGIRHSHPGDPPRAREFALFTSRLDGDPGKPTGRGQTEGGGRRRGSSGPG